MNLKEKVLGCLLGAAIGDAMGAATEMRTTEQIEELFGGKVKTFIDPPMDTFARGNRAGQVTDDFSIAYITLECVLENKGLVDDEIAKKSLIRWGSIEKYFNRFAGPTTRAAINSLVTGIPLEDKWGFKLVAENDKATNGAAMKASPIATLSLGDIDKAFNNCMILSMPTHNNNTALSAAAAVACSTACALTDGTDLVDIIEAGLKGAISGDEYGRKCANTLSNPSTYKKIKLALSYAVNSESMDELMADVSDVIGTSVYAYDSVPAAYAFLAKYNNNPMEPIIAAVNVGNDTDSIATIVGGIIGAHVGYKAFPEEYLEIINKENDYDLEKMADEIIKQMGGVNNE